MDIKEIVKKIEKTAPTNQELRFVKELAIGEWVHQGDVLLERIASLPEGKVIKNLQLAEGTTKGSRHILSDFVGVIVEHNNNELYGPAFEAKERFVLTHPEHAHYSLPSGSYQCVFQQNNELEELKRVRD